MKFCVCGQTVGEIRLADGQKQLVEAHPIPYRASEQGSMQLLTKDGQLVQATGCRPDDRQGIGYPLHRCPKVAPA